MAKSKYEYVKQFENHEKWLPNCWIVVRVDGKGFKKFANNHNFEKPNDTRSVGLMTCSARAVMNDFRDIILAYGQSDEYSFIFRKDTDIYNRRIFKLLTCVCSSFTSNYIFNWPKYFPEQSLLYPPSFDARLVLYPGDDNLRDYLSWRQADVHINNLYNTCFWNLVLKKNLTNKEAEEKLKGTVSSDKQELLFSEFGINYNNEPESFRRGTTLIRKHKKKSDIFEYYGDIIGDSFWEMNQELFRKASAMNRIKQNVKRVSVNNLLP